MSLTPSAAPPPRPDPAGPAPVDRGVSALWLLTALAFLVQVDVRMMTPLLPAMAQSLGVSVAAMGLAMTLYMLPYGLFQFVHGSLADRFGSVRVIRGAALGFAAGTMLTGQAETVWALDGLRFLTGAFAAAVVPLTLAYIGESVPYEERQAAIGRFAAALSFAQSLSAAIGGAIAHFVSWRVLFLGAGLAALGPTLGLFRVSTGPARHAGRSSLATYRMVLRRRAARIVYVVVGIEGVFLWGGFTYLGVVAVARYGLNELEVGLLLAFYGLAMLAGGMALGRIRALVDEGILAAIGGGLKGAGYLLLVPRGPVALFGAAVAMLGLGYIALHTTLQTRATELAPEARGTALALFAFCLFLGGAAGAALFGPLVDRGRHQLFLAICGVSLLVLGAVAARLLGRGGEP